jgi:hypothetical protein
VTVHLISVGLSANEFLETPDGVDDPLLEDTAAAVRASAPAEWRGADPEALSEWLESRFGPKRTDDPWLSDAIHRLRPATWPPRFSAEVDSLSRWGASVVPRDDLVVLLATDTVPGLVAAVWNALRLAAGDPDRVRYLPGTGHRPSGDARGCAVITRVGGLDAGDERGFTEAMGGLGVLGRLLREATPRDEPYALHLSGGFKAAVPYLVGLAEAFRSVDPGRNVKAYVLHDTAPLSAPPISLPLRRLRADVVRAELIPFAASGRYDQKEPPGGGVLDGYAYERDAAGYRRTAFGEGLHLLFGFGPESFAP